VLQSKDLKLGVFTEEIQFFDDFALMATITLE